MDRKGNHDPLVGIYFHSRDNKRVHDGRFVEHFNLGRKLSSEQVSVYSKSQDTQTFMIPPFGSRLNAFLILDPSHKNQTS